MTASSGQLQLLYPMKKTNKKLKPCKASKTTRATRASDAPVGEAFVTAQQASATLNLPLYYFINPAKRDQLGVPHYFINRLVRYRIKELHRWQVSRAARLNQGHQGDAVTEAAEQGGVRA